MFFSFDPTLNHGNKVDRFIEIIIAAEIKEVVSQLESLLLNFLEFSIGHQAIETGLQQIVYGLCLDLLKCFL